MEEDHRREKRLEDLGWEIPHAKANLKQLRDAQYWRNLPLEEKAKLVQRVEAGLPNRLVNWVEENPEVVKALAVSVGAIAGGALGVGAAGAIGTAASTVPFVGSAVAETIPTTDIALACAELGAKCGEGEGGGDD